MNKMNNCKVLRAYSRAGSYVKKVIIKIVKFYQGLISPYTQPHCRFFPSCSQYALLAIEKYGAIKGIALSLWRVLRCNPLNKGGIDIP